MKGARASPNTPLCPLKNVGGMRLDGQFLASLPFVEMALRLMNEQPLCDPLGTFSTVGSPDSSFWRRDVRYLIDVGVLVWIPIGDVKGVGRLSA